MASFNSTLGNLQTEINRLRSGGALSVDNLQSLHDHLCLAALEPSFKVAIHTTFGGFALTRAASDRLKALGVPMQDSGREVYLPDTINRMDPRLIQVIEELGEFASPDGDVEVVDVSHRIPEIQDHDGKESIGGVQPIDTPPEKTYWGALVAALTSLGYKTSNGDVAIGNYRVSRDISQKDWVRVRGDHKVSERIRINDTAAAVAEIQKFTEKALSGA